MPRLPSNGRWRFELQARLCIAALEQARFSPDCIFQCGLGNGEEVPFLKARWPDAKFVAVEASQKNVLWWKEKIKDPYPGKIIHGAVSDERGECHINSKMGNRSCIANRGEIVDRVTLDDLLVKHGRFGQDVLLWCDIEGSELAAFRGGREFLKHVRFIWVETSDNPKPGNPSTRDIVRFLKTQGFKPIVRAGWLQPPQYAADALFAKFPLKVMA